MRALARRTVRGYVDIRAVARNELCFPIRVLVQMVPMVIATCCRIILCQSDVSEENVKLPNFLPLRLVDYLKSLWREDV